MNVDQLTKYAGSSADCISALEKIKTYNFFLGMNLNNSPSYMIQQAWHNASGKQWGIIIASVLVPVLAALTQWINVKLMPQQPSNPNQGGSDTAESMQQSMKMMNNVMPLMSAFFCFTFSSGIGIYWIAGSVVRSIQQVVVNRHIDKIDLDELVAKNKEKQKKKLEKKGIDPNTIDKYASMKTKSIASAATVSAPKRSISEKAKNVESVSNKEKDEAMKEAVTESSKKTNYAPGSLAAKANMVREYNENSNK